MRLLAHVEGQTEETFINEVVAPHLYGRGYLSVGARLLGNARQRGRRGGVRSWPSVRDEIVRHLRNDPGARATLMVDYYGMPSSGDRAWPARADARGLPQADRARHVEEAVEQEVVEAMGSGFNRCRFAAYVVMHEFEGLLFSDCDAFGGGIGEPALGEAFQAIRDECGGPEEINDSPHTAPSKRVVALVPGYQKPLHGVVAALEVGMQAMRRDCPGFARWLGALETPC